VTPLKRLRDWQPEASGTSTSDLPTRSLAAANPPRSGTVSRSHTITLGCMAVICHLQYCAAVIQIHDGLKDSHLIQCPLWPTLWTQVRHLARSENYHKWSCPLPPDRVVM
jgi:hypothetical protein